MWNLKFHLTGTETQEKNIAFMVLICYNTFIGRGREKTEFKILHYGENLIFYLKVV